MTDLDEVLERFAHCELEYAGGLANHGPMVAEALVELGHAALLVGWVDLYAPRLRPLASDRPLDEALREARLGRADLLARWVATFEGEIAQAGWRECLARRLPELLPGLFAGAAHGLLRVAHAVRALDRADTAVRRAELARGLAYWAGRYQRLPGEPGTSSRPGSGCTPGKALARVVPLPLAQRKPGLFFDAVRALDGDREFVRAIESVDLSIGFESALAELCRAGVELYLENPAARIAYVHVLTAPSALRLLAPHLDEAARLRALGYAFQAAAALHAVSATPARSSASVGGPEDWELRTLARDPDAIRYRAACSLQEHAIKFAEACLREHAVAPDEIWLRAAADAALHLENDRHQRAC